MSLLASEAHFFIQDRALSLRHEARQFVQTAPVARAWLERASDWALRHGYQELAYSLRRQAREMLKESG